MERPVNRRDFLGSIASAAGAGLALSAGAFAQTPARQTLGAPRAPDGKPLRAGLIGCGGRGRGAMINFLDAGPNLQLVALADVFPDRIAAAREELKKDKGVEIADNRCYTGFDAFEKLINSDVDVVLELHAAAFPSGALRGVRRGRQALLPREAGRRRSGRRALGAGDLPRRRRRRVSR